MDESGLQPNASPFDLNHITIADGPVTLENINFVDPKPEQLKSLEGVRQGSLIRIADGLYSVRGRRDVRTLEHFAVFLELAPYESPFDTQ